MALGISYQYMNRDGRRGTNIQFKTIHAYVLSCFSHVQLFATPWTVAHQGPSVHGILQTRRLSCSPPGDLTPGTEPASPALQADSLPTEPPGKPSL